MKLANIGIALFIVGLVCTTFVTTFHWLGVGVAFFGLLVIVYVSKKRKY